jgi:L-methionine (R)-S-oxide reductase
VNELNEQIARLLKVGGQPGAVLEETLRQVLSHFQSETGTIHRLDDGKQLLHLVTQIGLPTPLLEIVKTIPVGKGIAGQVVARGVPVTLCDLQTDAGGVARPGARQTGVGGALCVPLRNGDNIVGTIGIGTARPYEYTPEQTLELEKIGRAIGEFLKF